MRKQNIKVRGDRYVSEIKKYFRGKPYGAGNRDITDSHAGGAGCKGAGGTGNAG